MNHDSGYVVGVDGCRDGWVAVTLNGTEWDAFIHPRFDDLVDAYPDAARIAIDIPIGLPTGARRGADVAAKVLLQHRQQSVFWAPDARTLDFPDMAAANAFLWSSNQKGMSIQAWSILPKIRQVNRSMTPDRQRQIIEVHPEVSFAALAGRPMEFAKKTPLGYAERRTLLTELVGLDLPERKEAFRVARPAKPDDLLDALVAAWSAQRDAVGLAERIPTDPEQDHIGLRMEIVF